MAQPEACDLSSHKPASGEDIFRLFSALIACSGQQLFVRIATRNIIFARDLRQHFVAVPVSEREVMGHRQCIHHWFVLADLEFPLQTIDWNLKSQYCLQPASNG
jgi:hypothetical protein